MDLALLGIPSCTTDAYAQLLRATYSFAGTSHHPSTHNAALLVRDGMVVLSGVNRLPPGVNETPYRFEGANKHRYPNHAETDVLYRAARLGLATEGLTMVMPWLPCVPCANAVISSGIGKLIVHKQMVDRTDEKWRVELTEAVQLLREAKVVIEAFDGVVGATAFMHKQKWQA